ncbi:manganese catalase family protein [Ligaoa zhengdingensis]|uniref:manganese catalase family protein n=1 Tax=Ligaoa zhengdingensis TaxID=2763658 RepID=UPI0031BA786B
MWNYQKRLQYPVKIKNADPAMARIVLAQLGGPDGEMGAATRYLNQRYAMPYDEGKAILTDIGTSVSVNAPLDSQRRPLRAKPGRYAFQPRLQIAAPGLQSTKPHWNVCAVSPSIL